MPRCETCGAEHDLLDPTFRRPEAYMLLDADTRNQHAKASDDLCRITIPDTAARYFVRGTLAVHVADYPDGVWWGLWAEISESTHKRILDLWSDPHQATEPPFAGALANVIPSYPNTLGLPISVQLTGPTSRPEFAFSPDLEHTFANECRSGVDAHRASEWNQLIRHAPRRWHRPLDG